MLQRISTLDATFIVLTAACGVALKPIIGPIAKLIGSALLLPGGAIAGAIYMMWPMLALLVVRRFGTALMVGFIQGIIVLITGFYGSHGILSLVTYMAPCLFIDVCFWILKNYKNPLRLIIPPAMGNLVGTLTVGVLVLHIPAIPLLISLISAFISGCFAGGFAAGLHSLLSKSFPQFSKEESVD